MGQARRQATVAGIARFNGTGVHSGVATEMVVKPGRVNTGIVFTINGMGPRILACQDNVHGVELCTVVGKDGTSVAVTEHLLAAFRICGITNAEVNVTAREVPIMDGSAAVFVEEFQRVGIKHQNGHVAAMYIENEISIVSTAGGYARVTPSDTCEITVTLEWRGDRALPPELSSHTFSFDSNLYDIARARTFGWLEDFEAIKSKGMALGASEKNTIALLHDNMVQNRGGLRNPKELVLHKCLDLVGDLAVLGFDIVGRIESKNPSHFINNDLRKAILFERVRQNQITNYRATISPESVEFAC
ncbi:MAG: UDP-3-O-acyl-N-acetylglucosamine deacetylase [Holosporales bacterium]|nr:UDP-3-O-acyl-N-acetylglucosamine deacetylase [Holosporales bacterium]